MLFPHQRYRRITDITIRSLLEADIEALILDVDNTMTTHDNPQPADGVLDWLHAVHKAGIRCIIVSNNCAARVEPFAQLLGIPLESNARKPLTKGLRRACERMKVSPKNTAVIGDQLFTDMLGGRLLGAHCILVDFFEPEHTRFFQFKRRMEKWLLKRWKKGYFNDEPNDQIQK